MIFQTIGTDSSLVIIFIIKVYNCNSTHSLKTQTVCVIKMSTTFFLQSDCLLDIQKAAWLQHRLRSGTLLISNSTCASDTYQISQMRRILSGQDMLKDLVFVCADRTHINKHQCKCAIFNKWLNFSFWVINQLVNLSDVNELMHSEVEASVRFTIIKHIGKMCIFKALCSYQIKMVTNDYILMVQL